MSNPAELWKAEKHGFDVWPDVQRYAAERTPMKSIETAELERMKWYGFFYRKRDEPGRYMNRIRLTAGQLTAAQAKEIGRLAYEFGHGIVDVTTRANVQIQGLEIQHLPQVAARLEKVGLTSKQTGHDNVRNVFCHPFSGLMAEELFDTRQLCAEITEIFLDQREFADLPRKMNICLNGTADHSSHFWTQDISFLAQRTAAGEVKFSVLIGGTQGQNPQLAWHLPVLVRPEQVVLATRELLELFRTRGSREKRNAARFCFLIREMGIPAILTWLEDRLPFTLELTRQTPLPTRSYDELIGWFRQRDPQLWTMGLNVPLGRLTWQQLEGLGVLAARWGDGQLRTTHEQGIAVINIASEMKVAALTDAAALGLSVFADSLDRHSMACTGSQFCNIAVTETKGQMFQLLQKLRQRQVKLEGIRIHMSGCPSSCAQHFTADIGLKGVRVRRLFGTREGFDVFLGGGIGADVQLGRPYRQGVDADQLPVLIEDVVLDYYCHHRPGQSFSAYWRERLPEESAHKVEDRDYQLPIWLCEKCQYRHAGIDPPIFCPSCAGLRRHFARLEDETHGAIPTTPPSASSTPSSPAISAPNPVGHFHQVAPLSAIPASNGLAVSVAGRELALFRQGEQILAFEGTCPHAGAPLAEGELRGGTLTCAWHGWQFQACDGCNRDPARPGIHRFPTRIEQGSVWVCLEEAHVTLLKATS